MDSLALIGAVLGMTFLGVGAGALTGLAPGIHVNNVAALVLATRAAWDSLIALLAAGPSPEETSLLLSVFLVAATVAHAVLDFVPSVFLGAPSEEVGTLLPGHRMLLSGDGATAVALAARGALGGLLVGIALLVPLRLGLGDPVGLFEAFRPWTAAFLVGLLLALVGMEAASAPRRLHCAGRAALVQGLAGLLGVGVLRGPSGLEANVALLPLFSGLFGIPGLLHGLRVPPGGVPPQRSVSPGRLSRGDRAAVVRGALAGAAVSWLPGLSGGAAASLASLGSRRPEARRFMVLLGATSTATATLSIAVLFVIGRARSGTAAAVRDLLGPAAAWDSPSVVPDALLVLVASSVLACGAACVVATRLAQSLATRWTSARARPISAVALVALVGLIAAVAGLPGLLVAALAALVGSVPLALGVRRVHLMASLLLPVLLGAAAGG